MKKMLVTFKYESQLNIFTALNYTNGELINEIVTLLRNGGVAMTNWKDAHDKARRDAGALWQKEQWNKGDRSIPSAQRPGV